VQVQRVSGGWNALEGARLPGNSRRSGDDMNLHRGAPRRATWKLSLLALLALSLLALAPNAPAETTLRMVPHADLKNIDPIWTTAYISRNHGYMVWDTLFGANEKLEPQPQMVDAWKVSADGLTYTFTLREGLRWHDGGPVTAEDCVASIQRWGKRDGMGQKLMGVVKSLDVVNQRTFRLVLKEPYGLVIDSLGKLSSNVPFMMPKRYAETDAFQQVPKESIGSGPFKFVVDEWVPGHKAVYVKNKDYKPRSEAPSFASGGKVVKVDRVEWVYNPDYAVAVAALQRGEVDIIERPDHDLIPIVANDKNIVVASIDPLGSQGWMRINHLNPPFDKPKAREALMWAVDQEQYLLSVVGNKDYFQRCATFYGCGTPYETDAGAEAVMAVDLEKAKRLLKESGYNGEKVVLMHPTDLPTLNKATQVTIQLLRKLGVNLEVQAMDWSTLTSRRAEKKSIAEGGWSIFHTNWIIPDVFTPTNNIGLSGGGAESAWFGWPTDAKLEDLRNQWARTTDPAKRKEIARQIQVEGYKNVNYIPIGQFYVPTFYRKELRGVIVSPVPFLWNISKG
jgi:peptide/nickel transport system substrate-binding protein